MKFTTCSRAADGSKFEFDSLVPQKKNTDSGSYTTAASIFGFSARMFLIRSSRILCRPDENTTALFDECSRHHKPVPRDPPVNQYRFARNGKQI